MVSWHQKWDTNQTHENSIFVIALRMKMKWIVSILYEEKDSNIYYSKRIILE